MMMEERTLTIRKVPAADHESLRLRAAKHGRSMEEEARQILHEALRFGAPNLDRFRRMRDRIRARHGGEMPTGEVDAFLRERREEAAREDAKYGGADASS